MVLTTHYMEEAARLCDRVAILDHGRVIALGTPAALVATLGADQIVELRTSGAGDRRRRHDGALAVPPRACAASPAATAPTCSPSTTSAPRSPPSSPSWSGAAPALESLNTRQPTLDDLFVEPHRPGAAR